MEVGGRPLVAWCLDAFAESRAVGRALIAAPPAKRSAFETLPAPDGLAVSVIDGGATRAESVRAMLAEVEPDAEIVCVHDGARPFVTSSLIDSCCAALEADADAAGVIAAAPITDTVKRVGEGALILATEDRSQLWAAQTPQVFRVAGLREALESPDADLETATDDAALVERRGGRVRVHRAPAANFKITTPEDLEIAAALLGHRN